MTRWSALARSAALNPSLTVAANALRNGAAPARRAPPIGGRVLRTAPHNHTHPTLVLP